MNKLARNEQAFAAANRSMAAATMRLAPNEFPSDFPLHLVCECANKLCEEDFDISYQDYQKAKQDNRFVVLPEHFLPEFEKLVQRTESYWLIAKKLDKLDKPFAV
jgi:hypothetical protein